MMPRLDIFRSVWCKSAFASAAAAIVGSCTTDGQSGRLSHASHVAPMIVAGHPEVLEMGPLLYAAEHDPGDNVVVVAGGVPNLFKTSAEKPVVGASPFDLDAGRADLAGQSETQALRVSLAHPDLRIISTVSEGLYGIVARRSAGITNLRDLRGKRIGTFKGTSAAYFIHRMLETVGLSENDVVLVPLGWKELALAIAAGQVDAIAMWEPESLRARQALGGDAIEFSDPVVYRELYNLNTTAAALSDPDRRRRIVQFLRTVIAASRISRRNPAAVQDLVAKRSGYDRALIAEAWGRHRFPATLPPDLLDVLTQEEIWLARETGRAPRSREALSGLIDDSVLREAQRAPVTTGQRSSP